MRSAHEPERRKRIRFGAIELMTSSHRVVLMDIDGTLLQTDGAGRASFSDAVWAVLGRQDDLADIAFAGATDLGVLRQILQKYQLSFYPELAVRFFAAMEEALRRRLNVTRVMVFPGVVELLDALGRYRHIRLGLLTGNTRAGARAKLEAAGLWGKFEFGAYGDEHWDRSELARRAVARSGARSPRDVWIVGDTPEDVRCARAVGARCLCVATGQFSEAALWSAGADEVIPSFEGRAAWVLQKLSNDETHRERQPCGDIPTECN